MPNNAARNAPSYAPRYHSASNRPLRRSSAAATALPASNLRVISDQGRLRFARTWPIVLVALLVLVVAIALPLIINTQMAQTSYAIRDQRVQLAELSAQTTVLEANLLAASSPQVLDAKARALGLVPAGAPGTVSLTEGSVTGGEEAR